MRRRAWVEPGATLADVDQETQAFGLATAHGINSTTGIAGLTLGGGFGWITRKFGLTIDNLISADVVTADGSLAPCQRDGKSRSVLGTAGRRRQFRRRHVVRIPAASARSQVLSGLVVHPLDHAAGRSEAVPDASSKQAPDELTCWVVMRTGAAACRSCRRNGTARKCSFSPCATAATSRQESRRRQAYARLARRSPMWSAPIRLPAGSRHSIRC